MIQNFHYLLDSNIISEIIKPNPNFSVIKKIAEHSGDCAISSTTWHELIFGVEQLEQGLRKTEINKFIQEDVKDSFEILPYTKESAEIQGQIRAQLKAKGFNVSFTGSTGVVVSQEPGFDTLAEEGTVINLVAKEELQGGQ